MTIYKDKANAVTVVPDWSTHTGRNDQPVARNDQPGLAVFLAVTKKCDIATQNLQVPPAMQKKKLELIAI